MRIVSCKKQGIRATCTLTQNNTAVSSEKFIFFYLNLNALMPTLKKYYTVSDFRKKIFLHQSNFNVPTFYRK